MSLGAAFRIKSSETGKTPWSERAVGKEETIGESHQPDGCFREATLMRLIAVFICVLVLCAVVGTSAHCEADATQGKPPAVSAKPSEPGKPYTSVIIDASGLGLDRCMSPKIRRANASEVWGTVKVDLDYVEEHGIVGYAVSLDEAKKCDRCGSKPMIIKAIARAGGNFRSDPVICDADADLLLDENKKGTFLDKFNVIFVKDGKL